MKYMYIYTGSVYKRLIAVVFSSPVLYIYIYNIYMLIKHMLFLLKYVCINPRKYRCLYNHKKMY